MNKNNITALILIITVILGGAVVNLANSYDVADYPFTRYAYRSYLRNCYIKYPSCFKLNYDRTFKLTHPGCRSMCDEEFNYSELGNIFEKVYGKAQVVKADRICLSLAKDCTMEEFEKVIRNLPTN